MTCPAPLTPSARTGNTAFATSIALLVLRLMLGWVFIFHGSQKLFGAFGGPGIGAFAAMLAKMGLPAFLPATAWAYMAACSEFVCGLCIFFGFLTRLATIPLIVTMLVAIANVTGKNGFSIVGNGYEFNLVLIAICVALFITGAGLISVDAKIFKRGLWARGPQPLGNPGARAT